MLDKLLNSLGKGVNDTSLPTKTGASRIAGAMDTMVTMHNELAQGIAEIREDNIQLQARRDEIEAEISQLAAVEDDAEEALSKITALIPRSLVSTTETV